VYYKLYTFKLTYRIVYSRVNNTSIEGDGMPTRRSTDRPVAEAVASTPVRRLRRPERREQLLTAATQAFARRKLATLIPDRAWARWAAQLAPVVAIEAVLAWLDADQPDPDQAADRIRQTLTGVITAAQ
jgi:hypothetical protein